MLMSAILLPSLTSVVPWSVASTGPLDMASTVPKRVLVIDDNVDLADTFAMLLEASGHVVRATYSGASGLEAVLSFLPDVVICDIGMPEMSGHDVARRIRAANPAGGPRLIAVSGWGDARAQAASIAAGFKVHLTKPVVLDDVLAAMCAPWPHAQG